VNLGCGLAFVDWLPHIFQKEVKVSMLAVGKPLDILHVSRQQYFIHHGYFI
jgi:hypothetical protein